MEKQLAVMTRNKAQLLKHSVAMLREQAAETYNKIVEMYQTFLKENRLDGTVYYVRDDFNNPNQWFSRGELFVPDFDTFVSSGFEYPRLLFKVKGLSGKNVALYFDREADMEKEISFEEELNYILKTYIPQDEISKRIAWLSKQARKDKK